MLRSTHTRLVGPASGWHFRDDVCDVDGTRVDVTYRIGLPGRPGVGCTGVRARVVDDVREPFFGLRMLGTGKRPGHHAAPSRWVAGDTAQLLVAGRWTTVGTVV